MIVENEWDRRLDGLISSDLRLVGGTEGGSGAIRRAFSRSPVGSDGSEGPGSSVSSCQGCDSSGSVRGEFGFLEDGFCRTDERFW